MTDHEILKNSVLFSNMSESDIEYSLEFFFAYKKSYAKNDFLVHVGDNIVAFGFVLSGQVTVSMDDIEGNRMIMANVTAGGTFGESLNYTMTDSSPIYITANDNTDVLWLDARKLHGNESISNPCYRKIIGNFISLLSHRSLGMNDRIQILSKKTIRGKLITYFSQQTAHFNSYRFTVPLDRAALSDYLGTERTALSRELSRMAADGIIRYSRNDFEILIHDG